MSSPISEKIRRLEFHLLASYDVELNLSNFKVQFWHKLEIIDWRLIRSTARTHVAPPCACAFYKRHIDQLQQRRLRSSNHRCAPVDQIASQPGQSDSGRQIGSQCPRQLKGAENLITGLTGIISWKKEADSWRQRFLAIFGLFAFRVFGAQWSQKTFWSRICIRQILAEIYSFR